MEITDMEYGLMSEKSFIFDLVFRERRKSFMRRGLVLEGGGLRGCFTAGVTDVMMEQGIRFDVLCGVSAGVLFGCNYKSQQPGRGIRYNIKYKDDRRYMSWHSLLTTGNYVNTEFAYHLLPSCLDIFDTETFERNPMEFYVVCTDIETGEPVYHLMRKADEEGMDWLRASASMPVVARPVRIDGRFLLDGGIVDSVPLTYLQREKEVEKCVVVLTQPRGYRKKPASEAAIFLLRCLLRKFPMVAEKMRSRHEMYNREVENVEKQEEEGKIFVIRPENPLDIGRIEQNGRKMKAAYEAGRKRAKEAMPALLQYLGN